MEKTTIAISNDLKRKLLLLKMVSGKRNLQDVIEDLLKEFEKKKKKAKLFEIMDL